MGGSSGTNFRDMTADQRDKRYAELAGQDTATKLI